MSESPPQVMIAFNHDLDVSQLATHSLHIEKLAAGAVPAMTEQVPVRLSVAGANLRALMVWPVRPLGPGHYRVVIDADSLRRRVQRYFCRWVKRLRLAAPGAQGEQVISTFDVEDRP